MAKRMKVLHLVDDRTAGGVVRVVDYLTTSADLQKDADHQKLDVERGKIQFARYDADIIVSHLALSWRNLPKLMMLRLMNASRTLYHVEHSYTEQFVALNVARRRRFETLLKVSFSLFDKVIAVSEGQANWIRRRRFCSNKKLKVIQSCVDLSPFKRIRARRSNTTVLGAIGRLEPQKGFDTLISGFRQIDDPTLELHIFGQGGDELKLRNLAAGDARIRFRGHSADPSYPYSQVDVVVMPSRWEAYGLVAIEALAARRALIAANIDGLVDHEPLGAQLYAFQSQHALCDAIRSVSAMEKPSGIEHDNMCDAGFLQGQFADRWRKLTATGC